VARLALIPTFAVAALAVFAGAATASQADVTVVTATVYDGSAGSGASQTAISASTLDGCPLYSGSNPVYLYPGDSPVAPVLGSSWALGTVITCGLQIPASSIAGVQVDNPTAGFETELSSAQLEDPSQWSDPGAPDALPFISQDGVEDQNTYVRPWLGGSDDNAIDQIVESAPIAIVVYEGSQPLTVTATAQQLSSSDYQFSATVTSPAGAVNPADLTYDWSFDDGSVDSSLLAPTHTFAPGRYPVTVQVTDAADGLGGTDTIDVQVGSLSTGTTTIPAGGATTTPGTTPTGPSRSSGKTPAAPAPKHRKTRSSGKPHRHKSTTSTPSKSTTTSTASSAPATVTPAPVTPAPVTSAPVTPAPATATTPATTPSSKPAAKRRNPAAKRRARRSTPSRPAKRPHQRTATGQLITGRLLTGVIAVPVDESELVQTVRGSAPRLGAGGSTTAGLAGGGAAVLLLFGLGAGQELRWRHRRSRPRLL
jgi:hypothetical protein